LKVAEHRIKRALLSAIIVRLVMRVWGGIYCNLLLDGN